MTWWDDQRCLGQVGKIDLAAPCPWACFACDKEEGVIEKDLGVKFVVERLWHRILPPSGEDQINFALAKLRIINGRLQHLLDVIANTRIGRANLPDDRQEQSRRNRFRAPDSQLASMRIADELDLLDPLAQLVECGSRAPQDGFAVTSRHN